MDTAVNARPCLINVTGCRQAYHKDANADLVVLDDVNLTLHEGEIVALLGRSGSGKSTLLRIVSGLLKPTAGSVTWRGAEISGPTEGVAMVFQSFALFPWLTVQENVEIGLEARGVPPGSARGTGRGGDRHDRPGRLRERLPEGTVRRHAPARRPGAGAGGASRPAADGRTVQRAGRADRRDAAHRPDRPVGGRQAAGEIGADGDAQHRGGGADVRPHPGVPVQSRPRGERVEGPLPASRATAWTRRSGRWWTTSTAS